MPEQNSRKGGLERIVDSFKSFGNKVDNLIKRAPIYAGIGAVLLASAYFGVYGCGKNEDTLTTQSYQKQSASKESTENVHIKNTPWSPDGKKIVFISDRDVQGFTDIYIMNADGTEQRRLTANPGIDGFPMEWNYRSFLELKAGYYQHIF